MLEPIKQFARFNILRQVARGANTCVYEAIDTGLQNRRVALLVKHNNFARQKFFRSVRIQAILAGHAQIPTAFEFGEYCAAVYSVRNFIDGDNLQNGIGGANRTAKEVVHIATQVASALDHAHARGVVHGLIHPRHILAGKDGAIWLIGFGEFPPVDQTTFGNSLHLAPEQLEQRELTPATDVYGLSETCWWLLTGRHPFQGNTIRALLEAKRTHRILHDPRPKNARDVNVLACLRKGMASNPGDRFSSPREFMAALTAAVEDPKKKWWWF